MKPMNEGIGCTSVVSVTSHNPKTCEKKKKKKKKKKTAGLGAS